MCRCSGATIHQSSTAPSGRSANCQINNAAASAPRSSLASLHVGRIDTTPGVAGEMSSELPAVRCRQGCWVVPTRGAEAVREAGGCSRPRQRCGLVKLCGRKLKACQSVAGGRPHRPTPGITIAVALHPEGMTEAERSEYCHPPRLHSGNPPELQREWMAGVELGGKSRRATIQECRDCYSSFACRRSSVLEMS